VKGWNLAGEPLDLEPWQEEAVRSLLAWDETQTGITLMPKGKGAGKSVVLYTAGRYARARAKGRPLRDDPARVQERSP
jgi:hypothetical protein